MLILAKSNGITLADHVLHLREEAARVMEARRFVFDSYETRTEVDLRDSLLRCADWHDEGKRHKSWQDACQKDFAEYQRTGKSGRNLLRSGIRHELASLHIAKLKGVPLTLSEQAAIAAHHGKLSERHQHRWSDPQSKGTLEASWRMFYEEGRAIRTSDLEGFESAIHKRYAYAGLRSLLQLIDHRASAAEGGASLLPLRSFSYKFPHAERRGVQQEIEKLWDEPFSILRAPTGAGKTDAALLWAQHQIEQGRADRLVIAMPTRFTANALAINVAENLSARGLYHSTARFTLNGESETDSLATRQAQSRVLDAELELARLLETPVTVTTIDHLCIALTGTREDHHAIFFNLAHACVVIDEADFYDQFTQSSIITLLRALRVLNVPVLLMSATVPESARETYAASGSRAAQVYEDKEDYERTRLTLIKRGAVQEPSDVEDLLERALNGEPTIIYANTVRRAQEYYLWLKEKLGADCENEVVLYHSRFTEPHKIAKEDRIVAMLGKEAWQKGEQHGIAVMTQIGEISVNISADLMIADMCPIDRLAQRAGRLARFKERNGEIRQIVGELFIVEPHRAAPTGEMFLYPAPYGNYQKGVGWITSPALDTSLQLLKEGEYSAKLFVDLVNQLYPSPEDESPDVRLNRRAFEDCIITNWLILPAQKVADDADETMEWKCRDIPPQHTVYVDYEPLESPRLRSAFRQWQLHHGVQCYAHEYRDASSKDKIFAHDFMIGDETETVWLVRQGNYSEELGLLFNDEARDDNII